MKKGNALMLSYMIFLVIAVLAQIFWDWNGLDKIAMSATIAGCLFAFADLAGWYFSYSKFYQESLKTANDSLLDFYRTDIDTIQRYKKEFIKSKETLLPYSYKDEEIATFLETLDNAVYCYERDEKKLQESLKYCHDRALKIDDFKRKDRNIRKLEIALVVIGFVVFFALITFQYLVDLLYDYQSFATVIAFFVIMLTYFLRDYIEERDKMELDDMIKKAEVIKDEAKKRNEKSKQRSLVEESKKLVKAIEKYEKTKSEVEVLTNGQT